MAITVENIPYLSLIWIAIGFGILIIGIFMIAHHQAAPGEYTRDLEGKENQRIEELFSFFLQEQEQKNEALRDTVLNATSPLALEEGKRKVEIDTNKEVSTNKEVKVEALMKNNEGFENIRKLYEKGITPEEIAKELKMGIGEVQLILSLYTMR